MGWVFAHVLLCHLLLTKNQPTIGFLLLAVVFTALVCLSFSIYMPNEWEKTAFLTIYTAFALTLHPFSADAIMTGAVASFLFYYGTKTAEESSNIEKESEREDEQNGR